MNKNASQVIEKIQNFIKENPKAVTGTLAAGAGAGILGGMSSAKRKGRRGEDKGSRRRRILRDALIAAATGGGAVALGAAGYNALSNALPKGDVDPVTGLFTSGAGRAVTGGLAGGAALTASKKFLEPAKAEGLFQRMQDQFGAALTDKGKDMSPAGKLDYMKNLAASKQFSGAIPPELMGEASRLGVNVGDELPGASKRFTGLNKVKDTVKGIPGVRDAISSEFFQKNLNPIRKRLSNFAYRHPGVVAAGAAGALLPEALSVLGPASDPFLPNVLHRE